MRWLLITAGVLGSLAPVTADAQDDSTSSGRGAPAGAVVHYQLPVDGPLPKTYRVTLAAVDPKDLHWVVSTFAAGVVRTVTAENQGKFAETWDGLDENFMPVPPGTYRIKGIFMPAQKWGIDGQFHSIVPKLASMGGSWGQSPSEDTKPNKIEGDPVGSPLRDVDVHPDGKGVVYFQYLENGTNAFLTDFTKPIGYDQIITGYSSGGIGGGGSACTDGKQIWILGDVEQQFILHADGTPFGRQNSRYCQNVYLPEGWVTGMSAWLDPDLGHGVVFVSEHGRIDASRPDAKATGAADLDQIVALNGNDASVRARWPVERPLAVKVRNGRLYVLHSVGGKFEVASRALGSDWREQKFTRDFFVPKEIVPFDLELDSHRRVYLSDPHANHVYQFDAAGKLLRTYGHLATQEEGTYDPGTFMRPEKLGCWTDRDGHDRLLVVEQAGPNRLSEWSGEDGRMLRQWVTPQTRANDGYAVDPHHPDTVYMEGQDDTLMRWHIDYATGRWTTEAVFSLPGSAHSDGEIGTFLQGLAMPKIIYCGNDRYLAFGRGYAVYHEEGKRWRLCAAVVGQKTGRGDQLYLWRDLNGDGRVQASEYLPYAMTPPPGVIGRYFGDTWFNDLSLVCLGAYTPDLWRLAPSGFDTRGTPLFAPTGWHKLMTDDVFVSKKSGSATVLRGGNELPSEGFDSAWSSVAQGDNGSIYVDARSGPDFSANAGGQFKLSRYDPDGKGGYRQRWRVGRMAFQGTARPGEVYGSIFDCSPLNGLVGLVDSARAGFELYTTDGLYVDTLFPDDHLMHPDQMGAYWQPGEYFSGYDYEDRDSGKIYLALGKLMPKIYEAQGWTSTSSPVQTLSQLDATVTLTADEIATPPAAALQIRGGPAAARLAEFSPAPGGGPALDGSMTGWEGCDPVAFGSGERRVEVRCAYDPGHLYLRWHARTNHEFEARPLKPIEHLFAHDRGNDTLGFYLQGSGGASGTSNADGRPGDVRFIFGLFKDEGTTRPEVLGMYPKWAETGAQPATYTTSVGSVHFENVALVPGVQTGYKVDPDGRGFVLVAAIPSAAVPGRTSLDGLRTEGNFDANFGGVDRFWWSNADGSASRETFDEPTEARLYPGSWSPVRFVPMNDLPIRSWMAIGPFGFAALPGLDPLRGRDEIRRGLQTASYPAETVRDWSAVYDGAMTRTLSGQHRDAWEEIQGDTEQIDFEKAVGWSGSFRDGQNDDGVVFLVTHIYSPQPAKARLQVDLPDGDHDLSGSLNGSPLLEITRDEKTTLDPARPINLNAGWNELTLRYLYIWGGNSVGVKLSAKPAVLWKLKIRARDDAEVKH